MFNFLTLVYLKKLLVASLVIILSLSYYSLLIFHLLCEDLLHTEFLLHSFRFYVPVFCFLFDIFNPLVLTTLRSPFKCHGL